MDDTGRVKLILIFAAACLAAGTISYFTLSAVYPPMRVVTATHTVIIEDWGQRVVIDNEEYSVLGSEPISGENGIEFYILQIAKGEPGAIREQGKDYEMPAGSPLLSEVKNITVPSDAYGLVVSTGGPVVIAGSTITETEPVDFVPIAAGIGVLVGALAAVLAAWYQKSWAEAAAELMDHGFHDMTIRDVEIVGYMMQMKEFTIPDLMRLTRASKITVWRTVRKLVERGLVRQTEKTRMASGGLGGRGKPSVIYEYIGRKPEDRKS